MLDREDVQHRVSKFRMKHGVQDKDEHIVTSIHLMNAHRVDLSRAQDQTSHGSDDHGIDGWHHDAHTRTLRIFQSKLSTGKKQALDGLRGLVQAAEWLGNVLATGDLGTPPKNPAIRNLAKAIDEHGKEIRDIEFILLSMFNPNELLDASEFEESQRALVKLPLNELLAERNGRQRLVAVSYDLSEGGVPAEMSAYPVGVLTRESNIDLNKSTRLQVTYLKLCSLVELFQHRGNRLFEKNVRLYLTSKEAKDRLAHPLEDTFDRICRGDLEPNIFPFYHTGITLTVGEVRDPGGSELLLETPNVINGCQTINIAARYLTRLKKEKGAEERIARFNRIPVLAKLVTAANEDQIREIANCNNRQNPIESWQLFSNDPIHVRLEEALADVGVFYERQKGKFDAEMGLVANQARYSRTNGTKITVEDLGQIVALARRTLQLAAKPSDIYSSKEVHDSIFDSRLPDKVHDAIWAFNARKAVRRGLDLYLSRPAQDNPLTHKAFRTPTVRQSMYFLAVMHLYQREADLLPLYGYKLNKKAPKVLVDAAETFYRRVVSRTKEWYLKETNRGADKISSKRLDAYIDSLAHDVNLDLEGPMPFTDRSVDWAEYDQSFSESAAVE